MCLKRLTEKMNIYWSKFSKTTQLNVLKNVLHSEICSYYDSKKATSTLLWYIVNINSKCDCQKNRKLMQTKNW